VIKKLANLIIFALILSTAEAGVWQTVSTCITDPCNCGASNPNRFENWDGERLDKGPENKLCPPWNKGSGRDDNTCLANTAYPEAFTLYHGEFCGEESPDSTYFEPKITVRSQHCNAAGCWTRSDDLGWDGECITMVGGYVSPLHRMCARVALPAGLVEGIEEDPGYTKGEHLNFEGATKPDEPIQTSDGGEILPDLPKLCLYRDPSLYSDEIVPLDALDLNPNKQPIHKTQGVHPVVEALIFFSQNAASFGSSVISMFTSLLDSLLGGDTDGTTIGSVLKDTFNFLSGLFEVFGTVFISNIEEAAQINRIVHDDIYGCVNIPMGPNPPPYCEEIEPTAAIATTQRICYHDLNGDLITSIEGEECVISNLRNNYIHNSIRVSYDKFIPLCENGEDTSTTDLCVDIDNLGAFSSAQAMHLATGRKDIIRTCETAVAGEPCVRTMINHTCSVDSNGCNEGFRVVYAAYLGSYSTPSPYFRDDMNDCPSAVNATCQKIWGVNVGEFADISLVFDPAQNTFDTLPLTESLTLANTEGEPETFDARIVRIAEFDDFTQDPNEICVFEGDRVVGCQPRAPRPKALIHECDSNVIPGLSCTTNYFNPKFIASYKIPYRTGLDPDDIAYDISGSVIEPLSNHSNSTFSGVINLIGNELEAFVTDDTFASRPFSGPNAPTPASIFGTYQNNIPPITPDGIENLEAVYVSGLEYINDKYHLGGKYACLSNFNNSHCPTDPTLCVLTKLENSDVVLCSEFFDKRREHNSLEQCTIFQNSNCNYVDSIDKIGGGTIEIKQCTNGSKCYNSDVELCKVTTDLANRFDPSPDLGETLSDSEYFDTAGTSSSGHAVSILNEYDDNLYGLRTKTAIERGYCVEIPLGVCSAQSEPNEDNGYASWPEALSGEDSLGTCANGLNPLSELKRKCVPDPINKTFNLEPLFFIEDGNKIYTDVKCQEIP